MWTTTEAAVDKLRHAMASRYPLIYVVGWEEDRIHEALLRLSRERYGDDRPVVTWSANRGFHTAGSAVGDTLEPRQAVRYLADASDECIYHMKDLPAWFGADHALIRDLRELYRGMRERNAHVVMSYPTINLPEEVKKEIFLIRLDLPTIEEIRDYLMQDPLNEMLRQSVTEDWLYRCSASMRGLALNEVRHLTLRLLSEKLLDLDDAMAAIHEEKAQVLMKESCLEVMPREVSVDHIGGHEVLKEWIFAREVLFSKRAYEQGVPTPTGVLFMGVSGCGKSLAAKAIADAWELQLVRLDMNLVLSGAFGSPEYAFNRAVSVAESISPVVLWIDELENAFGYDADRPSGGNMNIFSAFLTWMQEKPASVFVAATANRIQVLPAEMIRRGRFDQVFFLDLPLDQEREDIFRIHIALNKGDLEEFSPRNLALMTDGWTGAEIEQAVKAARVDAFAENRAFTQRDVSRNIGRMVPLSRTMREQVSHLRNWSMDRATPTSNRQARQTQTARRTTA